MGQGKRAQSWGHNRQAQLEKEGREPNLPDLDHGGWLLDAFFEAGAYVESGMGRLPLDWPNLLAFSQATGAISEPWEYRALMQMSRAYLEEIEVGKNPLSIEPMARDGL